MKENKDASTSPHGRSMKWLKWILGILSALIVLACIVITAVIFTLKPEHLTPLVEKYAPRFINGEVKASRIELTFWHTFPRLTVEADSLIIISHALESADGIKADIPAWSDTLATVTYFNGTLNLSKLLKNELEIYDVDIVGLKANVFQATSHLANYNIVESPADENESDSFSGFSISNFRISDSGPFRYVSLPDSMSIEAMVNGTTIDGSEAPEYSLTTSGNVCSSLLRNYDIENVGFSLDGSISFTFENGISHLDFEKIRFDVDSTTVNLSTAVSLGDSTTISRLEAEIKDFRPEMIKGFVDSVTRTEMQSLRTDLKIDLSIALTEPYTIDTLKFSIPSAKVSVDIPQSRINWKAKGLYIDRFILKANADIDGNNPDKSRLELHRLLMDGQAIDIDMRALITHPLLNPRIAGEIKGRVFIDRLPKALLASMPGSINGTIGLNTSFRFRQSQLNAKDFHKIFARGTVSLRDFDVRIGHRHEGEEEIDSLILFTPLTMLRFESDKTIETNGVKVDSLLSVVITADSLYYYGEDMDVNARNLVAALGSRNVAQSADTSQINPFGGSITADRLRVVSEIDSTRLSLRELKAQASLSRFHGMGKVPELKLQAEARRLTAGMPNARISLSRPAFTLNANINPRREARTPRRNRTDSLVAAADTLAGSHRADMQARRNRQPKESVTEDSLSSGLRTLLRRWNIHGEFTARRARLFTPSFPINNTITDLDLHFTTDSIDLHSMKLKAGSSDFNIAALITGLKSSMSKRRNKSPLKIEATLSSDSINIDELSRAVFAGAAAERDTSLWNTSVDETMDVSTVIDVDTTVTAALIVPDYIDAALQFRARNVIYTDLLFHNFTGELGVWDEAIHLHDLYASSPMGDLSLSALYSAPSVNDLEFGMGMQLLDFHLERFLQVTPAISELLPAMKEFSGIINAEIALTTRLGENMDFLIPSMQADVKIDGDSLVLLDADTFKTLSKWLFFKNKKRNLIDHMSVELQVDSSQIVIFPFIFNIDRYKLGVMGSNDLDMNFNYHVSVLKSPIPFKFGINISGNLDKYKIRTGGAKIKENTVVERLAINSDTRINLLNQIENVFRRSANSTGKVHIHRDDKHDADEIHKELRVEEPSDTLTEEQRILIDS